MYKQKSFNCSFKGKAAYCLDLLVGDDEDEDCVLGFNRDLWKHNHTTTKSCSPVKKQTHNNHTSLYKLHYHKTSGFY